MEFTYESRRKIIESFQKQWELKNFFKLKAMSSKEQKIVEEIEEFKVYRRNQERIEKIRDNYDNTMSLGEYMKNNYSNIVELYVSMELRDDYYYIVDKLNKFQYSEGYHRRCVRTSDYKPSVYKAFRLLYSYRNFTIYKSSVADFILNNMPQEILDLKENGAYNDNNMPDFDCILAARIDKGDEDVKQAINEILTSDNNTAVVTVDIIRAMVKSSDDNMHKVLCDFLLAAKQQEGVRQAICENADCGTVESFKAILKTIRENDLMRFAAVKRASATWTGLCNHEHLDRISNKVFEDMFSVIEDLDKAHEYINSDDSIHIIMGLWALGCYEVKDSIEAMVKIVDSATKNQLLTMSYYNRSLDDEEFAANMANKIIEKYPEDYELIAAYMPTYISNANDYAREIASEKNTLYPRLPVEYIFKDKHEAQTHFTILNNIYMSMKKKELIFEPCIFPWYSVELNRTQLVVRMAIIAYALQDDEIIDYICGELGQINMSSSYYYSREYYVKILLHRPDTAVQRKQLLAYVVDRESYTRTAAFKIADKLNLTPNDYEQLEKYLKYKNQDIRSNVITLLQKQKGENLCASIERVIKSTNDEMRLGALDMVRSAKKTEKASIADKLVSIVKTMDNPSPAELIILDEITGKGNVEAILSTKGYGLYDPDIKLEVPKVKINMDIVHEYFNVDKKLLDNLFNDLIQFIEQHIGLEYKDAWGNEKILGTGGLNLCKERKGDEPLHHLYPFPELWREFFETKVKNISYIVFMQLAMTFGALQNGRRVKSEEDKNFAFYEEYIFGFNFTEYTRPIGNFEKSETWNSPVNTIIMILESMYQAEVPFDVSQCIASYIGHELPEKVLWNNIKQNENNGYYYYSDDDEVCFTNVESINDALERLKHWDDENEFEQIFWSLYSIDNRFQFNHHNIKKRQYYYRMQNKNYMNVYWYIKAYIMKLIPEDIVYKAIFELIGIEIAVDELSICMKDELKPYEKVLLKNFMDGDYLKANYKMVASEFYNKVVEKILDVELKRGDSPTVFSNSISFIEKIYGMDRMVAILTAMGKSSLDRQTYYGSCGTGKKECLSHLLQVSYPSTEDCSDKLGGMLCKTGIKDDRLVETAMYAPQWIDIIEEYLGYKGLKSGCYYFMAHMNETFDDKKQSIIAKYTPLTMEELHQGAFDAKWFYEVYEKLGDEVFNKLYNSAKYISDGSKHSRARKFADAALKRISLEELENQIDDKRNKDLLMSYGIVPVENRKGLLHRYEYLQKFLKESKQFGAQRRASEALAVDMAMKNLATSAGYSDVMRLTLAMETELVKANEMYFQWNEIEGYSFKISVDENGASNINIMKDDKKLKAMPTSLKKHQEVLKIKEFHNKLKDQYGRTVKMFEQSMENSEVYTFGELCNLMENPVTGAIVKSLVFIGEDFLGFLEDNKLAPSEKLRVAHPVDLYKSGQWHDLQQYLFNMYQENGGKQPFKQVFRELYVKLPEEMDKFNSMMFAGNQIQPKKTVGCLKGRRWIADYEDGLQKVYYKDDIIARIYALADWFSPADIESPQLEWVEFSNRKTFEEIKISEVPDIIYSEVMRDVDLAVSVAHVGGVDPETSHSTVEMRKVIFEFNLQLFKLNNVTFEKNHAFIKGKRGTYTIHLGSGVIHQLGGTQINVLPVHSQQRGKIFLPFIDEDPKTAEIMSKILLCAEDNKIKDPYILEQITTR